MQITKIKKRDDRIVDFDRVRIENAIEKAFMATKASYEHDLTRDITDDVLGVLEENFVEKIPGVEDVQDIVEKKIAERGFFEVAKRYIIYRKEHEKRREEKKQELLRRIERSELRVKKRDGTLHKFDIREIEIAIRNCCRGYEDRVDAQEIINDAKLALFDGISTREINQAVVMAMRARIERDPIYSYLTARFLFNDLYKDVLETDEFNDNFEEEYRKHFPEKLKAGVVANRLDARLLEFDLKRLSQSLVPQRDKLFAYLGAQTLYDRYFLRDVEQQILETPQYFWMRIAMGLVLKEQHKEEKVIEFYDVMSSLRYIPSTPTLFHSGTVRPQMSSCYLTTSEDDLEHIFKCLGDSAQLAKWAGGIGMDWSNIRGTGALIKSTNIGSQGVIPFLKIVDATTAAISRTGGRRRGATCVYLETWHYDIEDFLDLRKNTGDDRRRTHDTNTANWIPDLFMKRVLNNEEWTLFSPHETPDLHELYGRKFEERYEEYEEKARRGELKLWKRIRAIDLWRKMITMLYETGHPWMTFKDVCNIRSPQDHVGVVHSSNLCTEITLNTSRDETAVCNLGSINLPQHIIDDCLDKELLSKTVKTAMRMLDNVIDLNFYPTKEAENSNLQHRPVGLGVMGTQDVFYKLRLDFESQEAVEFSDATLEFIAYQAILASSLLAKEKGAYPTHKGSKWDRGIFPIDTIKLLEEERGRPTETSLNLRLDWAPVYEHVKKYGMRNSNCLAIAPTATIANIAGCFPSIEPIYKNLYVKSNFSGEFTVINNYLVNDLKKLDLWNEEMLEKLKYHDGSIQLILEIPEYIRKIYKEVFDINPKWLIDQAAHRGKWIDQSQSLNVFTASTSGKFISDIYIDAWKKGLKTTYYLRTLGASAIEKSTLNINKRYDELPEEAKAELVEGEAMATPVHAHVIGDTCESCQ